MEFPFASMVGNQSGLYWNRYRCNCRMIILQNIHLQYVRFFSHSFSLSFWIRSMHFERTFSPILFHFFPSLRKSMYNFICFACKCKLSFMYSASVAFHKTNFRFKDEYSSFMKSQSHMLSLSLFLSTPLISNFVHSLSPFALPRTTFCLFKTLLFYCSFYI